MNLRSGKRKESQDSEIAIPSDYSNESHQKALEIPVAKTSLNAGTTCATLLDSTREAGFANNKCENILLENQEESQSLSRNNSKQLTSEENNLQGGLETGKMLLSSIRQLKTDRSHIATASNDLETTNANSGKNNQDVNKKQTQDNKLNQVLQKLSDYKSGRSSQQNEQDLVCSLENELADIISIFQNERVGQSQEIEKLSKELKRLHSILAINDGKKVYQIPTEEPSTAQQAKFKCLEELLRKTHRECCDSRKQVIRLQQIIRERDRKIDELQRIINKNENCSDYKIPQKKDLMSENKKLLERIQEKELEIERSKEIIECLSSAVKQKGPPKYELLEKLQGLESFMINGQNEYMKKTQEYCNHIHELEQQIENLKKEAVCYANSEKNKPVVDSNSQLYQEIKQLKTVLQEMEQKCTCQAEYTKSLQESNLLLFS